MNIKINGKDIILKKEMSLLEFIADKSLNKDKIVIEKNFEIVKKQDFKKTLIQESDSLEIVSFVSGG